MGHHTNGKAYRLAQSYIHQKEVHSQDTLLTIQAENRYLKQQIEVLKKYEI
ncbi:hypothetical protein PMEGAPL103_44750 [Priestia megaterium]|jgi:transposase|uniref:hypothetical protein n=1 Tax=Priestia megaterium TaxID=1404 RepID=UPI00034ACCDB